jgi:hypothetical protein
MATAQRPDTEEEEEDGGDAPTLVTDRAQLKDLGDTEGLLSLARAYRGGTQGLPRDMSAAFLAYRDAAELGSAEAEFAVALFLMTGGVVPKDTKEATTRLRKAAELGSVPAKVYLGNLYEQGVHYACDAEKADVWYRSAARSAGVTAAVGTDEHTRAMGDLGSVRAVRSLETDASLETEALGRYRRKAKAHGMGLRVDSEGARESVTPEIPPTTAAPTRGPTPLPPSGLPKSQAPAAPPPTASKDALAGPADPKAKADAEPKAKSKPAIKAKPDKAPRLPRDARATVGATFGAFGYALLFLVAASGVGYALTAFATAGPVAGVALPVTKEQIPWLLPVSLLLLGVLPQVFFYRAGAVLKSLVSGLVLGAIGFLAWGTGKNMGQVLTQRTDQTLAFGVAGFVAVLFVLGFLGGARPKKTAERPSMTLFPDDDDE